MGGILAAEWTKLRSVRSTYWLLVVGAVATVGLAVLITVGLGNGRAKVTGDGFDAAGVSLLGVWFGQIAFGVVGALSVTAEYTTGTIRPTLTAVPSRGRLLAAKLVTVGLVVFGVGTAVSLGSFLAGQAVLSGQGRGVGLGDPGAAAAVFGAGGYLAVIALAGVALVRHTVGAVLWVLGLGLGSTILGAMVPAGFRDHVLRYLPGPAGTRIAATDPPPAVADYVVLGAWVAGLALVAWLVLRSRDA